MNADRQALEALVIDNPDLERLETLLDDFNIFEVLGAVRQEVRHSEFLSYLMDPMQTHGLGDYFVKRFLQKALVGVDPSDSPFTAIDLDIWSLDDLEVRREWQNIDILLLSEQNKLAVVIENKIGSAEHSGQLARYRKSIEQHYPKWKILYLFLTPEGDEPTDQNYIPVNYAVVADLIDLLVKSRQATLGPDIRTMMEHYAKMLRRHILSGSEIEALSRNIYRKHKRALDMIYEYRPDLQSEIYELLMELVGNTEGLILDHCTKTRVRFLPQDWNEIAVLSEGKTWTSSGRMLLFELVNSVDKLKLFLTIGPGPEETRQKLFEIAGKSSNILKRRKTIGKRYSTIYVLEFLKSDNYEDASLEDIEEIIKKQWGLFIRDHLPKIKHQIEKML